MAALTILSHNEPASELSLQQHLDITPSLVTYNSYATEGGDSEPLMMAQPVPHQATDKKRVKVYELRDNDWFDRGTGFCTATFATVRPAITSPVLLPRISLLPFLDASPANSGRVTDILFSVRKIDRRWPQRPPSDCRV